MEWHRLRNPAFVTCVVLLLVSAAGLSATISFLRIHLQKEAIYPPNDRQLRAIPSETKSWIQIGSDEVLGKEMADELGTRNYLNRNYIEKDPPDGRPAQVVEVHMAYYTDEIDTVPHVPERCLVGGGMIISETPRVVPVGLDRTTWLPDRSAQEDARGVVMTHRLDEFGSAPNNRVRMPRDVDRLGIRTTGFTDPESGGRLFAGYFFLANGEVALSAEEVRLKAFDLKTRYAYYLKVQVASRLVSSSDELGALATGLLSELMPEIMRCVPDWVDVEFGTYPVDRAVDSSARGGGRSGAEAPVRMANRTNG